MTKEIRNLCSEFQQKKLKTMNISTMVNVTTTQRRKYYIGVSMNESIIANVATMQRHRCYVGVSMNESIIANIVTTQHHRCCSFDSPGLARNEPTLGKHSQGDSTPSVLSFFRENMVSLKGLIGCYSSSSMNISTIMNVLTTLLGTSCSFDSPGLARNEPTLGKHSQGDSTP